MSDEQVTRRLRELVEEYRGRVGGELEFILRERGGARGPSVLVKHRRTGQQEEVNEPERLWQVAQRLMAVR